MRDNSPDDYYMFKCRMGKYAVMFIGSPMNIKICTLGQRRLYICLPAHLGVLMRNSTVVEANLRQDGILVKGVKIIRSTPCRKDGI